MPDNLLQQLYFTQLEVAELTERQQQLGAEVLNKLNVALADYRREVAHINSNGDLSDKGKATRRAKLAQEIADRLEHIATEFIKGLQQQIANLTLQLTPQRPDTDPVVELLRQQELRNVLREKNELELIALYQSHAVNGKNDLLMRALEEAPMPMITDPAILVAGKEARAKRQSPESAQELAQLKQLRATLEAALNTARAELDLPADELVTIARTGAE